MRAYELMEGGWESTATQSTKITPGIVKSALKLVERFTNDFNEYLKSINVDEITMGHPTGSTAYHDVDDEDKVYGDIDMQMIAKAQPDMTMNQLTAFYNKHSNDFIKQTKPSYILDEGKEIKGHIIFNVAPDVYVQVDMIWAMEEHADWSRYRTTPERGVKGLVYGSVYSALGVAIHMSIQLLGAQMKIKNGVPANFQRTRKADEVRTLSLDISNFGIDILTEMFKTIYPDIPVSDMKVDPLLQQNPGLNKDEVRIKTLVNLIKGLGKSFEDNDMYGKYNLMEIYSYNDFIAKFMEVFMQKTNDAKVAKKFDKAETPEAIAKVQEIKQQIEDGQKIVQDAIK